MSSALHFNPLTFAELDESPTGPVLTLRSFAPGRSLLKTMVVQPEMPELFAWLYAWLQGNAPETKPVLTREQHLHLWTNGLLISDAEASAMPAQAHPSFSPESIVAALCPSAGTLFGAPLRLLEPQAEFGQALRSEGLVALPCLFDAPILAAICAWYKLLASGNWLKPDRHLTSQRIVHNDPVARHVQASLVPVVSELAGERLKPSFSYATQYVRQANLPRHTDRAECEYTLSIYVDYLPDPPGDFCPWPLLVHSASGDLAFHQERGGGLLFRGRVLEHSRPALPPGDEALLFLLCYVKNDFEGLLD